MANRPSDPLPTAECFRSGKVTVAAVSGEWGAASSVQTAVKTARTEPAVVALTVRAQGRIAGPHGAAAESMAASHLPIWRLPVCGLLLARLDLEAPVSSPSLMEQCLVSVRVKKMSTLGCHSA